MWDHSFCIRDRTNVSCFGSGILYHRATMQDPLFQIIFLLFFFFHWGGKDLQYCVAFRCRATQFSDTHVPVYSFTNFLTLEVIIELSTVPCLYSRCRLNIYVRHTHWCLHVNTNFLSILPFSFGSYKLDFCDCESISEVISLLLMFKFDLWMT